jgi:outer membrane protein assembly factor BamB
LLRSFDPETGEQLWRFDDDDRRTARKTPTIVDGMAYLVSGGLLYAVDIENQKQRWKKRIIAAKEDPTLASRVSVMAQFMSVTETDSSLQSMRRLAISSGNSRQMGLRESGSRTSMRRMEWNTCEMPEWME